MQYHYGTAAAAAALSTQLSRVYHQITDSGYINRFSTRPFLKNCSVTHWTLDPSDHWEENMLFA